MKLYLVQHGEAVSKQENPDRPLSKQGEEDINRCAAFMGKSGIRVDQSFHSGKTRAKQSAELLAVKLLSKGRPERIAGIKPNDPLEPFADSVANWDQDTLVVGHLPFMAKAVSLFLTGSEDQATINYQLGAIVCLEKREDNVWGLAWMVRPELIV